MNDSAPLDEMVDGTSHVRPHWRGLFGTMFSLGHETLAERARLLERAFVDEGITAMLPGEQPVNWRCDPIPLILSAEEFAGLEQGLAQRARLIDAILVDVYGAGNLMAERRDPGGPDLRQSGVPAALLITGPDPVPVKHLHVYAADLMRGPDGVWRVVADRADQARGLAYALENRRILARIVPEIFQYQQIEPLRPFMEITGDAMRALAPDGEGGVALLCGGHSDPLWFEHVLLSREMSIGLVEPRRPDLRDGQTYPEDPARPATDRCAVSPPGRRAMDPLELLHGPVRPACSTRCAPARCAMVNHPGSRWPNRPVWPPSCPVWRGRCSARTCTRQPGDALAGRWRQSAHRAARPGGLADPPRHRRRLGPVVPMHLSAENGPSWPRRWTATPAHYAAWWRPRRPWHPARPRTAWMPKPIALRMFLTHDGTPGGCCRAASRVR